MMIKYTRFFITFLLALIVFQARSQSTATSSSPYSAYGLGDITPQVLPQNIGMGGLSVATNSLGGYSEINPLNPASYSKIYYTIADVGIYSSILKLSQTGQNSETDANFRLSHVAFAFPVSKHSALSFGLLPYSEFGYNYKVTRSKLNPGSTSAVDTNEVDNVFSGQGGLSKAYLGYGFGIGKHLSLGANMSYIFGKLQSDTSTEIPNLPGTLNSRIQDNNSIHGLDYDFGGQYTVDLTNTKHLIFGYSASSSSSLTSQATNLTILYTYDSDGNQNIPIDTLTGTKGAKNKVKLPFIQHFGISYVNDNKLLVGAEYSSSNWSQLTIDGVNQGLQNSKTYNVGASFTPNINALNNYWATVDYKIGAIYNQTYVDVYNPSNNSNTNIKNYALTFGLGFPLRPNVTSFYKINFSAEIGQTGTLANSLVKENYVNLHLSFTLNDRWFIKYKIGQE